MHNSKIKLLCRKCSKEINIPNYKRHVNVCRGVRVVRTEWVCEFCNKKFNTAQGYNGHKSRSHTHKHIQTANGRKGNDKKQQMEKDGHIFQKCVHTAETKERLSILACERLAKHSKYSKNIEYKPGIILESSYEVKVAKILDELCIKWDKVRKGFVWDDNGQKRRYIPDFYLPEQDIFLDPKNDYLIKKDKRKIKSAMQINNIRVVVLSKTLINKDFIELLLL